jgi:hypothetical protein
MSPIYMIGGEKEDGKSFLTMAFLEYLDCENGRCLLVDTDVQNPDVYKIYSKKVSSAIVDLDSLSGWAELVNICDVNSDKTIVINGSVTSTEGFEKYGKILLNHLFSLQRHLITFWVISSATEDLSLLERYRNIVGKRIIHLVKNYAGLDISDYPSYENSSIKEELKKTGRLVDMPELDGNSCSYFTCSGLTIQEAIDNFTEIKATVKEMERRGTLSSNPDFEKYKWRNLSGSCDREISEWLSEIHEMLYDANYRLGELVGINGNYQAFTRLLAGKIEEALQSNFLNEFYDSFDDGGNDYHNEDIGDLLAEGRISIEDLASEAAQEEDQEEELEEKNRLRLEKERKKALEPETEEEYQQRAQEEYWRGGNPEGFIPSSKDIEERADWQYITGQMPKGYTPRSKDIEERANWQYITGQMPKGYIPTAEQLRMKKMYDTNDSDKIPF